MIKQKIDKQWIGIVSGLIIPLISSFMIYSSRFQGQESYAEVISFMFKTMSIGKLMSLSVLPNLLFFFIIIKFELMKCAKGIVIATAIYSAIMLILFLSY